MPIKSEKKDTGKYGESLKFANVVFEEGDYVYSDADGIIISRNRLHIIMNRREPMVHCHIFTTYVKRMDDDIY